MGFNLEQNDRLMVTVADLEQLMSEADEEGAEAILDELYMLVTKLLEQFPSLDKDDE